MQFKLLAGDSKHLKVDALTAKTFDHDYNFNTNTVNVTERSRPKLISSYRIRKELVNAVNAAIVTGRPLLLKGEPGCGKTKLAQAVAAHFFGENAYRYYFEWHVKSKSKARDGGYTFDHVGRLRDATISNIDDKAREKAADVSRYVRMGPMGFAFKSEVPDNTKPILLIDEIDKGDIDFPNDLLLELDEMRFKINEIPDTYIESSDERRPLVFITSNDERELPPAFLRRCLYYYIPPFTNEELQTIALDKLDEFYRELQIKTPKRPGVAEIESFVESFQKAKANAENKPPSTSELLDWLRLVSFRQHHDNIEFKDVVKDPELQSIALKLNA